MKNYSELVNPIVELTKKSKYFKWAEPQQQAFDLLKKQIEKQLIRTIPNFDLTFIIRTDASDLGIAGVLFQMVDGAEKKLLLLVKPFQTLRKIIALAKKKV